MPGGGVVGSEYACIFTALGVLVDFVPGRDGLVPFLDREVARLLEKKMLDGGVMFHLKDSVEKVRAGESLEITMASGETFTVGAVLVSLGRMANTQGLGLEEIGVLLTERRTIHVNVHYQTSVPHIYAAGDVIGPPSLAAAAMEEARVAMVHAFDLKYKTRITHIIPYGIYTIPECAMAGKTEEELRAGGAPYIAGRAFYEANSRGQILGETECFLKLLFHEEDMKLIGVHIIGPQASELIHTGLTALQSGAHSDLFIQSCYNFPTLSEMYKYATYDAMGRKAMKASGRTHAVVASLAGAGR